MPSLYLDKTFIGGNLTSDPEVNDHGDKGTVVKFGVATNRQIKQQNGEYKQDTNYFDVNAWGPQGEFINKHYDKGDRILIVGRHNYRSWEDNDGNSKSKLEIVVEQVQPIEDLDYEDGAVSDDIIDDEFDDSGNDDELDDIDLDEEEIDAGI